MQRFALIGAGFIGGVHAENLAAHPDVDFALVYDVDEARAQSIADRYNANVATLDEAFDPTAIDAVLHRVIHRHPCRPPPTRRDGEPPGVVREAH